MTGDSIGLFDAIYSCRAMRRLHPDPVPLPQILRLIEAAYQAPSGRNLQRARWIVVRDARQKRRIAELNRRASEEAARQNSEHADPLPHHEQEKRRRMWKAVLGHSEHMHERFRTREIGHRVDVAGCGNFGTSIARFGPQFGRYRHHLRTKARLAT
jgi:nitroreductase